MKRNPRNTTWTVLYRWHNSMDLCLCDSWLTCVFLWFIQAQAQEGTRGGTDQEEDQKGTEVPACHCWCLAYWDLGQEEPETWGSQGTERPGHQVSWFFNMHTWLLVVYLFLFAGLQRRRLRQPRQWRRLLQPQLSPQRLPPRPRLPDPLRKPLLASVASVKLKDSCIQQYPTCQVV